MICFILRFIAVKKLAFSSSQISKPGFLINFDFFETGEHPFEGTEC
jgi:hypothetical protein